MSKIALFLSLLVGAVLGDTVTTPSCVETSDSIVVGFENANPKDGDWIALYRVTDLSGNTAPDAPALRSQNWLWTCGSQSCKSSPTSGPVRIPSPLFFDTSVKWVAALLRYDGSAAPYDVVSKSAPFSVRSECAASQPQPRPTPRPSPRPTRRPTPAPTNPSTARVTTDKLVYQFDEPISVTFNIANPRSGDWVAIYDANVDLNDLGTAHFWLWVCDRQGNLGSCGSRSSGTLVFQGGKDINWGSSWPLIPGQYRAITLRDGDEDPWTSINASPIFTVAAPTQLNVAALSIVRKEIENLINGPRGDIKLAAQFLRLGFHDCVGGCDGCVDQDFHENFGTREPIMALKPIADKYSKMLSRADIWALATLVGSDVSQPSDASFKTDFAFEEIGRVNCENRNQKCFNQDGDRVACDVFHGPHREVPGPNLNSEELFGFFDTHFSFNTRETVTIMGGHTIGEMHRNNSCIDAPNGWLLQNRVLDNEYYVELVGSGSSLESQINNAPNWVRHFESNSDLPQCEDRNLWIGLPEGRDGRVIKMLNADIAVVRNLNPSNMNSETGKVSCAFVTRQFTRDPRCPANRNALEDAVEFRNNNRQWLREFDAVLRKMLRSGYTVNTNNPIDGSIFRLNLIN